MNKCDINANSVDMILNDLMKDYGNLHVNIAAFLYVSPISNKIEKRVGLFPEYYEASLWLSNMKIEYLSKHKDIVWSAYVNGSLF